MNRIYIHIPFCSTKCDYCAFHSVTERTDELYNRYFGLLETQIKQHAEKAGIIDSIYIGGGTPSILPEHYLDLLFNILTRHFKISDNAEISMESNPESLTKNKINLIAGFVNRISLGIQTFNENSRKILGRKGKVELIFKSIENILNTGISNLSFDLIYGIPGQKLKDFKKDIDTAMQFPFKHVSAYSLTFEENTILSKNINDCRLSENAASKMWQYLPGFLADYNMKRYEISNYSLPKYECQHNMDIWYGSKYLGLGPSATSFDGLIRWTQPNLDEWLKGSPPLIDKLAKNKRIKEIFIMGLRTANGWFIKALNNKDYFLCPPLSYSKKIPISKDLSEELISGSEELKKKGLLNINVSSTGNSIHIYPGNKGLLFWNEIGIELI